MADIDTELLDVVQKLATRFSKNGAYKDKFITHIRFPHFKNLRRDARVDFNFPVTALVGSNGSGKTSVLHALYGAPEGRSTQDYWFSTALDPIDQRNDDPHRFVYGHWLHNPGKWLPEPGAVETRKARYKHEGRSPDYWEPTKAADGIEMPPVEKGTVFPKPKDRIRGPDRWTGVRREVTYLNFRRELGAFDQYFWFGPPRKSNNKSKQDLLREQSSNLLKALEDKKNDTFPRGRKVFSNNEVNDKDIETTKWILDKEYDGARVIEHNLFALQRGVSAVFRAPGLTYSEAFAGSGEIAVLRLVTEIRAAQKSSLILLDEPEVSLHPAAQKRLLKFLLDECLKNNHQVVFTTHSPHLIESLPPTAIKVFAQTADGKFDVLNEAHPYVAFNRLGATSHDRVTVLVEDRLAERVVKLALRKLSDDEQKNFDVKFLPGGADTYLTHRIPTYMQGDGNTWLLLDGDQLATDATGMPVKAKQSKEVSDDGLEQHIYDLTKKKVGDIILGADGGNDPNAANKRLQLMRKYLDWFHNRVRFLPRSCPEEIVLLAINPNAAPKDSQDAKQQLRRHIANLGLDSTADQEDAHALTLLAQKQVNNADLEIIKNILKEMHAELGKK